MSKSARIAICVLFTTACGVNFAIAQDWNTGSATVGTYGTPGLIDMPTGTVFPDGEIQMAISSALGATKYSLSFQVTPRILGTFRYSGLRDFSDFRDVYYDRSFDVSYLLAAETHLRPSIVAGLRDFGGTGIYASEYVAATKHFANDRLAITGGMGWGRLATSGGFDNPFSAISDSFNTRGPGPGSIDEIGQPETDQWFRGDAALFGGFSYEISPRLTFAAEYSSDGYLGEVKRQTLKRKTPFNAALNYNFKSGANLSIFALHGSEVGFMASIPITPNKPPFGGGIEEAPRALTPRQSAAALSWSNSDVTEKNGTLYQALDAQGISLEAARVFYNTAHVRIANRRYGEGSQAIGRTMRAMATVLPDTVETFVVETTVGPGIPTTKVSFRRSDLESLEYDLENGWRSYSRAQFDDAFDSNLEVINHSDPAFEWSIKPFLEPALFDPDNPVRVDVGIEGAISFEPLRGLRFSTAVRQPIAGNLATSSRPSNSVLPHVRTDAVRYSQESDFQIKQLTAEYFFRPAKNVYARSSIGLFETMFGGVSGEVLWRPVNSALSLGAELNYVKQRDFDQLLGFQDYGILTGHASAYYDLTNGYLAQVDVGRYLAGDFGATFSLDREFDNGFRVGAFFTITDVSSADFGEGAFDKGIRFTVPTSWLSGTPNQKVFGTTIRPVQRDGGARLSVPNRLYELTHGHSQSELKETWGRFWR